ncbi:MAG: glycosyltransferase family 2 protein [Niabella sp.]
MRIKTAIIILNYKNYTDTITCVERIFKFSDTDLLTVFVIDNDSQNNSLAHINEHFSGRWNVVQWDDGLTENAIDANIILVQNSENKGYAYGNNVGLKIAYNIGYQYLLVLNNDTLFVEDVIPKLKLIVDNDSKVLCAGPLLLKGDGVSVDFNCAKRRPTYPDIFRLSYFGRFLKTGSWRKKYYYTQNGSGISTSYPVDILSGSCMFFNAGRLHEIGYFDDATFLYYEEAILAEKGMQKGYSMVFDPGAKVIHLGAQSTRKQRTSLFLLDCEYNSLKLYLNKYRKVSGLKLKLITFSNWLFIQLYKLKSR